MLTKVLGYTAAVAVGLAVKAYLFPHAFSTGWAVAAKLTDRGELCSWERTLSYSSGLQQFERICERAAREMRVTARDTQLDLERLVTLGARELWMTRAGDADRSRQAWLFAEQDWLEISNTEDFVQPGDVVVDVGAGPGVFVAKALRRGASKVLAIEGDSRNLECLRRNFRAEIAFGRVVLAPVIAGASDGAAHLPETDQAATDAPVTTIDKLVADLKIARVHFIRIDTDGREALKGAERVLRQDRPRVMAGLNRNPVDAVVLPKLLQSAHRDYAVSCGPCQEDERGQRTVIPRVVYFR
jgi:FkbM family methyltransferase